MSPAEKGRRLAAFLADAGVASRRKAEDLVRSGAVTVNGRVVLDPAFKVDPGRDAVEADSAPVRVASRKTYLMLNKPAGYLSASEDRTGKPTVLDLVPGYDARLFPVGRLDFNAEGLVLLTDDGDVAYRLTHPRYQVPRVYLVKVKGKPAPAALAQVTRGVRDKGELLRAREVRVTRTTHANAWVEVVLTEGKNRELRRLFMAIGYPVIRIIRVAFGPLFLDDLAPGRHRRLSPAEVRQLKDFTGGAGGSG